MTRHDILWLVVCALGLSLMLVGGVWFTDNAIHGLLDIPHLLMLAGGGLLALLADAHVDLDDRRNGR